MCMVYNLMAVTVQICPDVKELSEIKTNIKCTHEGCGAVFSNTPNLEMHLIKTHHKESLYLEKHASFITFQFFCPVVNCKYELNDTRNVSELRWFSKLKFLKQHYFKVHKEKNYVCDKCHKKFVSEKKTEWHKQSECGKQFVCKECNATYNNQAALLTHSKRKNHSVGVENERLEKLVKLDPKYCGKPRGDRMILPKINDDSSVNIAAAALSELSRKIIVKGVDKGVQTANKRKTPVRAVKKNASLQTYVGGNGSKISAETQTTAVYPQKRMLSCPAKSMHTQTLNFTDNAVDSQYLMMSRENKKGFVNEIVLSSLWEKRNESSTQTNPVHVVFDVDDDISLNLFNTDNTFVDSDSQMRSPPSDLYTNEQIDRLIQQSTIFDDTRSCNIETQTEFSFSDSFIDDCPILSNTETQTIQNALHDVYSHNCTQTCDDGFFDDLVEFADIETQTAWANRAIQSDFVSAETQTIL